MASRRERKEQGLCIDCGREPIAGRHVCEEHAQKRREASLRYWRGPKAQQRWWERVGRLRQEVTAYKVARGCEKCGEKHPATLDFHHLDPTTKEYNIGAIIHTGSPAEVRKVWDEIAKCVVLCANCHRKEHWKESALDG